MLPLQRRALNRSYQIKFMFIAHVIMITCHLGQRHIRKYFDQITLCWERLSLDAGAGGRSPLSEGLPFQSESDHTPCFGKNNSTTEDTSHTVTLVWTYPSASSSGSQIHI